MSQEIISKETKRDLATLKQAGLLKDFYLAGGTGLALQLNHRLSLDLDFFTPKDFDSQTLITKIKNLGRFSLEQESENSLTGIFEKTKISFLKYDYPLLFPLKELEGIKVADGQDIGCMKISAASSRGTKKDFIDLYFLCQKKITLPKLLKLFQKKYASVNYNTVHLLKSLTYFADAEKDPLPKMIAPVLWEKVKSFFRTEVEKLE